MNKKPLGLFLTQNYYFLDITDILCQQVSNGSVAILYFTNTEQFGRQTAASQYFLQMAGFLGIPVIAWNADNAGLESVRYVYLMIFANIPCSNHHTPSLYLINKHYIKVWTTRCLYRMSYGYEMSILVFNMRTMEYLLATLYTILGFHPQHPSNWLIF